MERKIVRKLNWYYYGVMVFTLIVLCVLYYLRMHGMEQAIDPMSELGKMLQSVVIMITVIAIPFGLYLIKWRKPKTEEEYLQLAELRIIMVGLTMPLGIAFFYLLGAHRPMIWLAAMGAIAWYFTKPTEGKVHEEMRQKEPGEEDY